MYGGMKELFIEECVVQPSRLGKSSDFLDIGSGIGQVVIQVACTVGCKSIGLGQTLILVPAPTLPLPLPLPYPYPYSYPNSTPQPYTLTYPYLC